MTETQATSQSLPLTFDASLARVSITRPIGTLAVLLLADIIALMLALLLGGCVRELYRPIASSRMTALLLPTLLLNICYYIAAGLYPGVCDNPVEELRRLCMATTLAFLSLGASTFLSRDLSASRMIYLVAWFLSIAFVPVFRSSARSLFSARPWWGSPVAILGAGSTGKLLLETLQRNRTLGLRPVAMLDDNPVKYEDVSHNLIVGPLTRCLEMSSEHRISYAIVCMPGLSRHQLLRLLDRYGHCFSHIMVVPDLIGMASLGLRVREVGGIIGLEVSQKLLHPSARFSKRALDLFLTLLLAPIVLPLMLLCIILIKLESPGSAFYPNERIGYRGRKFHAWKLRTMVTNGDEVLQAYLDKHPEEFAHWSHTQKLKRDPRVTRVGRILRKASIDELPQLWNVLIGEMSIVGPRPFLESQIEMYGSAYVLYQRVRPGITGLWQISGRNELTFKERARLDAYTIQNWSVWLDLYILARTISVVLTARGAY